MDTNMIILLIVLGGAAALVAAGYIGVLLGKKGINISKVEETAENLTAWAVSAADAIAPYLPKAYGSIILTITKLAAKVVQATEALSNASLLPAEQRKTAATNLIKKELADAKITVDANVEKLISVSIDAACLLLPHHIETTTEATTATTQATTQTK